MPEGWYGWVERIYAFIEGAPQEAQHRYRTALRWFNEAIDAYRL